MIRTALALVALVFASGCAANVEAEPAPESPACVAYRACAAVPASIVDCSAGSCWCMAPTHPGENSPIECHTGDPDQSR